MSEVKIYKDSVLSVKRPSVVSYKAVPKSGYRIISGGEGNLTVTSDTATIPTPKTGLINDVVLWDRTDGKKVIAKPENFDLYDIERYAPIGVMVVPIEHNVYDDGTGAMISIVPMSCSTPDMGGTSEQNIYWGGYKSSGGLLVNAALDKVVTTINVAEPKLGNSDYAYLPSDNFSSVKCIQDENSSYNSTSNTPYAPSPFLTDGSRNPDYYDISDSGGTSKNALADFDGKGNTETILINATAQSNWKTESSITNNKDANYYPAACCCWRFHTEGTKQGDWYLPSCGELGYMGARVSAINYSIGEINKKWGVGVQLSASNYYWSSSEYSSTLARGVGTNSGSVISDDKDSNRYVRAFLRVGGAS